LEIILDICNNRICPASFADSKCGKLTFQTYHYNLRMAAKVELPRRIQRGDDLLIPDSHRSGRVAGLSDTGQREICNRNDIVGLCAAAHDRPKTQKRPYHG